MECALSLAGLALGYTSPNPAVGAVIVRDGIVVGLGHTQPPGCEHAEIMALQQAGERAKGATLYVTLEPCCHQGRTPPCTKAIIEAGISEVYMAMLDPNPLVSGKGLKQLQEAGIRTYVREDIEKAREINEGYIKYITTGLPFVIAKFAMSLDGKIATRSGESQWISGEESRKYVHNLRHIVDAVMVGANTVLVDDPQLSARGCSGRGGKAKQQPLRVIVDGKGRTPLGAQIFKEPGKTLVAVAKPFDAEKANQFREAGAEVVELAAKDGEIELEELLKGLGKRRVTSILVEGGNKLFGSLFDQCLVDKVMAFISPIIIGGSDAKSAVGGNGVKSMTEARKLSRVKMIAFGEDILISGYLK
ncbi:MAG: bifunctional diaminohydroxyphosphoribosylaminopyrimidine deaminase/5-amino-6-(5-phosphoribosylamino)uracil reductase RibD [Chloroflexi bacterium]|nr:bifunctional diaminohydroxyphosphoribosylaminopyrimidine deaminase/5-amino-6-(5-phosphoribosylamino)uracil reductase RibD [Chloroflexota bacterium]MBM3173692.1 bifunctional diaminohydroxyphosphoribosylaminopyrimidine deaminase/5-amino-6-(5-phosphoribosylamino)uracil reductase RibD [Chloroflexota bacterium]MBM3175231.1 bifunctional diaminohydroxyphosphoribosylaminopyrimidine deaminase/5-amino-6-(5-phosphoribosylamino)uracil reductase RibD [Chloroflexota bacterium]MBM4451256.1 bifunctional diam